MGNGNRGLVSCALTVAGVAFILPGAQGALPGRTDSADLVRLAAQGDGRINGAGPSLDRGLRWSGAFGFGPPSCGEGGMTERPVLHPQASLHMDLPRWSRRLDLVVRPLSAPRDLVLSINERALGTVTLREGWQRVSVPLVDGDLGPGLLQIKFTESRALFEDGEEPRADLWGWLHTLSLHDDPAPATAAVEHPLSDHDTLWLEAGQALDIPAPLQVGQGLEAAGVRQRGQAAGLRLHVELVSIYGAVESLLSWPAVLDAPWNLDLSRRNERTPVTLRLRVTGTGTGAVGLVAPVLTVPAPDVGPAPAAAGDPARPATVVVVAVRGLRMTDLAEAGVETWRHRLYGNGWAAGVTLRASLASLVTGTHAHTHGMIGIQDLHPKGMPLMGEILQSTGARTILRAGYLPIPTHSKLWSGFDDIRYADPPKRPRHAPSVLGEMLEAVKASPSSPVGGLVILGDIQRPYAPQSNRWKAGWPPEAELPWDPARSRAAFRAIDSGRKRRNAAVRQFERALRQGKVDEVLVAIDAFRGALINARGPGTRLLVVGLGDTGHEFFGSLDPRALHVPVWLFGGAAPTRARRETAIDLPDVAATAVLLAGGGLPDDFQGRDIRTPVTGLWPSLAFSSRNRRADLAVAGPFALFHPRKAEAAYQLWRAVGDTWEHVPEPSAGDAIRMRLLAGQLDTWLGAGRRWRTDDYESVVAPGAAPGWRGPCR